MGTLSLYKIKNLLKPQRNIVSPADDFRVLDSWVEYEDSTCSVEKRRLDYMMYEIEVVNPESGEKSHIYKAIKFMRLIRVPKSAKQSTALMDMHQQVLTAAYELEINLATVIANIKHPVPIGLLFNYGVQGVSTDVEEAKKKAELDFASLTASLQGTFRTTEFTILNAQEIEWLKEKMYGMNFITSVRGIPRAAKSAEDAGNKGMGGNNLNPDSQGTLEEIITGLADYEYVIEALTTPVPTYVLKQYQTRTESYMTDWYSQLQGQKNISFNVSLPMVYAANAGTSTGTSHAYSNAESVTYTQGENYSTSFGENQSVSHSTSVGESLSQSFGESIGHSTGTTISDSVSQGVSTTASQSLGQSVTLGQSANESMSTGTNIGSSMTVSQGVNDSVSVSENQSISSNQSNSAGNTNSVSENTSYGVTEGQTTGLSHSLGETDTASVGESHTATEGTNSSVARGDTTGNTNTASHSNGGTTGITTSEGSSTSWNNGYSSNLNIGSSSGISVNLSDTKSQTLTDSHNFGGNIFNINAGSGNSNAEGNSQTTGNGVTEGISGGYGQGTSFSEGGGTSHSVSGSSSVSNTDTIGQSSSESHSKTTSTGNSSSISEGLTTSDSHGTTESYGTSDSKSLSQNYGASTGTSQSQSFTDSVSKGWSQGNGLSQSSGTSSGISQGMTQGSSNGYSTGTGTSYSSGQTSSQSISQGTTSTIGRSYGQTSSDSYSQNMSVSQGTSSSETQGTSSGTSKTTSNGTSYSKSNGTSQTTSNGTSQTVTSGMSSSLGLGPSMGYSKSYQWMDQQVKDIIEVLEFDNNRYKRALRGEGAFYTYLYIACPTLNALAAAQAVAKSAWQNEYAMTHPLQVLDLNEDEQQHLLYHFSAFSTDVTKEDVYGMQDYRYCTVLLPSELVAYTHPPRVSEGGIFAEVNDIPKFSVPGFMRGEIYMGTILSAERYTMRNGYRTEFDYRLDESELMHALFCGQSRSGKTVAAMRFVAELSQVRRKATGKRMRIVCLDPKRDWRGLARYVEPERFRFFSLGNINFRPIKLNPWKIPYGVNAQQWIDCVVDLYCRSTMLLTLGMSMIKSAVYPLYQDAGVFDTEDPKLVTERSKNVTFEAIYKRLMYNFDEAKRSNKAGQNMTDAYARISERLQAFSKPYTIEYKLFGTSEGMGMDELIGGDEVTVIESKGLDSTFKNFIFGVITSGYYRYATSRENGFLSEDEYETVMVIEEANEVLIGSDTAGSGGSDASLPGQSEFENILDQAAGWGYYLCILSQKPSMLPTSVLANAGLKFIGRMSIADDVAVAIRSIAREERYEDRDILKFLPKMPTGWFIIHSSRGYDYKMSEPVLVNIAKLNSSIPSNDEIDEILSSKEALLKIQEIESRNATVLN